MAQLVSYSELSVNERINLRSGFDIAVARESGTYNRFNVSRNMTKLNKNCCQKVYDIDRCWGSTRSYVSK
jgi:hypothetical protein